jgi:hypothetical protein
MWTSTNRARYDRGKLRYGKPLIRHMTRKTRPFVLNVRFQSFAKLRNGLRNPKKRPRNHRYRSRDETALVLGYLAARRFYVAIWIFCNAAYSRSLDSHLHTGASSP